MRKRGRCCVSLLSFVSGCRPGGVFELDLHGLHASEAVAALQLRLAELEEGSSASHGRQEKLTVTSRRDDAPVLAARTPGVRPELMVITGK